MWHNTIYIKVRVQVSLCLIKHHAINTWGSGGLVPCIHNFGTRLEATGLLHGPTPIEQEAGWAPELVCMLWRRENPLTLSS